VLLDPLVAHCRYCLGARISRNVAYVVLGQYVDLSLSRLLHRCRISIPYISGIDIPHAPFNFILPYLADRQEMSSLDAFQSWVRSSKYCLCSMENL
jgi:hypothetical protein